MSSLDHFKHHEKQIFHTWEKLTAVQREALVDQLKRINVETLKKQKSLLQKPFLPDSYSFEPFDAFAFSGHEDNRAIGQTLIRNGQVGCLLLAGGQGTRLQHNGPKGTYPISPVYNKSLFQLCAEKIRATSNWAKRPLQIAIMTSPDNDEETKMFFQTHDYFGLKASQVNFFIQGSLPLLDAHGKLFLKTTYQIASGADGNGNSLLNFAQSGLLKQWLELGITVMTIIPVDNPLADPFDAELIGYHAQEKVEITLKCTEKTQPEEKVGVLVKQNARCTVVEYSEMPDSEKNARRTDGKLKHCCANLSLFCLSVSFIQRMLKEGNALPLHKAWKSAQGLDNNGMPRFSSEPIAWKFETFIFDWLLHAKDVAALLYPREECFAPLKNLAGPDSPETVRRALQQRDRSLLHALTGLPPPDFPFELSSEFYYPTHELQAKWKGRQATTSDFA